jgi:hypothetical protein
MSRRIFRAHLLSLVVGGLVLLRFNRQQWFYGDEWAFLGGVRRTLAWPDQLLEPHNEHWSTAPYLVYRVLEATFGIRSYWPYIGLAILLHLLVVHLVWRVMLQAKVAPWIATVVVLPLIVLGAGSQNLLWAFQIGFLGSLALGLGAMLLVNHSGAWGWRDWVGLALICFALLWSGFTVLLVAVCALVVLLRRGIKPAAAFAIPPAVIYIVWALAYPPSTDLSAPTVRAFSSDLWPYVATGLATAANAFVFNAPLLGAIGVVALLAYLVRTAERATTELAVTYACAAGAVAQFVLSAYARQRLGLGQASETRYGYIAIVLLAPALAMVADRLLGRANRPLRAAFVVVFLVMTATNAYLLRIDASDEAAREGPTRALILAAAEIANDPLQQLAPDAVPEPRYSPDLTVADLRRFGANDDLPTSQPAQRELLTAAANLQVGLEQAKNVAACRVPEGPRTTVIFAPNGATRLVNGTPGATMDVTLTDPVSGAEGGSRRFVLPSAWSVLTVYRHGVSARIVTPPNVHLCP